ncbi:uncharacterized protein LOC100903687 [Galendromus occidentalis]|uniref:Uncharacterized protein LOC100903687 n=1 Tax=Galendromus occidentalis TaxID=34638 RepID=A0AAJ7L2M9_9ACAR|nr:uncharacterized protein LOC100903687 [Galendromus occidentalis]
MARSAAQAAFDPVGYIASLSKLYEENASLSQTKPYYALEPPSYEAATAMKHPPVEPERVQSEPAPKQSETKSSAPAIVRHNEAANDKGFIRIQSLIRHSVYFSLAYLRKSGAKYEEKESPPYLALSRDNSFAHILVGSKVAPDHGRVPPSLQHLYDSKGGVQVLNNKFQRLFLEIARLFLSSWVAALPCGTTPETMRRVLVFKPPAPSKEATAAMNKVSLLVELIVNRKSFSVWKNSKTSADDSIGSPRVAEVFSQAMTAIARNAFIMNGVMFVTLNPFLCGTSSEGGVYTSACWFCPFHSHRKSILAPTLIDVLNRIYMEEHGPPGTSGYVVENQAERHFNEKHRAIEHPVARSLFDTFPQQIRGDHGMVLSLDNFCQQVQLAVLTDPFALQAYKLNEKNCAMACLLTEELARKVGRDYRNYWINENERTNLP